MENSPVFKNTVKNFRVLQLRVVSKEAQKQLTERIQFFLMTIFLL